MRLGRHLSEVEIEKFAREDPKVRRHLDVIKRKELLELVLEKMESLKVLEGREKRRDGERREGKESRGGKKERKRGGWNLF